MRDDTCHMSMKKCWLPGFLTSLPTEKNKNVVLWQCADQIYPPFSLYAGHFFFCLLDILRGSLHIVCCTHIYHHSCLSFLPLSPVIFCLYPSHTETDTPPSPSSYSRGMSKCACPTQRGVRRVTDKTCSALL